MSLLQNTFYGDNNIINENNIQHDNINSLHNKIKILQNKNDLLIHKNKELETQLSKIKIQYNAIYKKYILNEKLNDQFNYTIL